MNYSTQEKIETYTRIIETYLNDEEAYEFVEFLEMYEYPIARQLNKVLEYAKKYVSPDLYKRFIKKLYPFGEKGEDCSQEQTLLREKVKVISSEIAKQNANIIDVFEHITRNLDLYLYYLKQSRFYYGDTSAGTFKKVKEYIEENKRCKEPGEVNVTYKGMTLEEDKLIRNLLNEKEIPINSITYAAMREYALARKIIKHGNLQKNSIR